MRTILGLASAAGIGSLAYALVVLGQLSRHLGEVVKMRPYYRIFYVAAGLAAWAALVQVVSVALQAEAADGAARLLTQDGLQLAAFHIPLTAAMLLSIVTAWRYWGWLLRQK